MSDNADRIASLDIERLRRAIAEATAEIGAKARQANALDTERRRLLAEQVMIARHEDIRAVIDLLREIEAVRGRPQTINLAGNQDDVAAVFATGGAGGTGSGGGAG